MDRRNDTRPGQLAINSDAALGAVPSSPSINITFTASSTLQGRRLVPLAANRNILIGPIATATFNTNGNTLTIGGVISGSGGAGRRGQRHARPRQFGNLYRPHHDRRGNAATGQRQCDGLAEWKHRQQRPPAVRPLGQPNLFGRISGSGGVQQAGTGTLLLGGTNSFTGTTTINPGILKLGNPTVLKDSTVVLSGGSLNLNSSSSTLGGLAGSGSLPLSSGTLTVGGNGNATTYSGNLSVPASWSTGSSTLTLTGTNSYSGGTSSTAARWKRPRPASALAFRAGKVNVASGAALILAVGGSPGWTFTNVNSLLAVNGLFSPGASLGFDTNGGSVGIGSISTSTSGIGLLVVGSNSLALTSSNSYFGGLAGSGNVAVGSGTLNVGGNSSITTYSGNLSGAGAFVKVGSNTQTLSGTNSYSGGTLVSHGGLEVTTGAVTAFSAGKVNVASGAR